jgi:hypothetical protein
VYKVCPVQYDPYSEADLSRSHIAIARQFSACSFSFLQIRILIGLYQIYALYKLNKKLFWLLAALCAVEIATMALFQSLSAAHVTGKHRLISVIHVSHRCRPSYRIDNNGMQMDWCH